MPPASPTHLPRLEPAEAFPPIHEAWGIDDPAPGLLAAGGRLDVTTLCDAYSHGIFPWFSEGQPILWWSTDPRMVLPPSAFRLHRSLAKTLHKFRHDLTCDLRFDTAFGEVIRACAHSPRNGARGTWIVPDMVAAYEDLHRAGFAHSIETWVQGKLVGGLYCVAIGHAVFGESMFSHQTDASKIALAGLVAFCKEHGVGLVDCQQNTPHLASLGAYEISRSSFAVHVAQACKLPSLPWQFENVYWNHLSAHAATDL
jgi:leucyl/phenylalanyl-tRNA--protein transferase